MLDDLLTTPERDYLLASNGDKIPVARLRGRSVLLLFATSSIDSPFRDQCRKLLDSLAAAYSSREFEVVFVSCDTNLDGFQENFQRMPWLAVPYEDVDARNEIIRECGAVNLPKLVLFDRQGRLCDDDAGEKFLDQGFGAFKDRKFLPGSTNLLSKREIHQEVKFSEITQKLIGFYFSAHSSRQAQSFTPKLAAAYKELKDDLEIIFVSSDPDPESFAASFRSMPWPALPFADSASRTALTDRLNHLREIPRLVIVEASSGRTITAQGCWIISQFGSQAFPFTDSHIAALLRDSVEGKAPKVLGGGECGSHGAHIWIVNNAQPGEMSHQCAICNRSGSGWMYICKDCSYRFHPECADEIGGPDERFAPLPPRRQDRLDRSGSLRNPRRYRDQDSESRSCLPDWITRLVDPEMKRTVITSAMAGLITVAVGVCSFLYSKLGKG